MQKQSCIAGLTLIAIVIAQPRLSIAQHASTPRAQAFFTQVWPTLPTRPARLLSVPGLPPSLSEDRKYCYQKVTEPGATGGGTIEVNGFTIDVKPARDPDVADQMTCRATVRSPSGGIVFEKNDWGMEIDPVSGKDVNGDGFADAVLVGFSGGAHCCWTYYFVSLGANPGLIAKFGNRSSASFDDLNRDGKTEILIRDGTFDEGFGLAHAFSPFPLLIVRLEGTTFQDVGSQFWPVYDKDVREERQKLKDEQLRQFLQSKPSEIHDETDYLETESRILSLVLDYLYAGRASEAHKLLAELWPASEQDQTWAQMLKGYCSGLRSQLRLSPGAACAHR